MTVTNYPIRIENGTSVDSVRKALLPLIGEDVNITVYNERERVFSGRVARKGEGFSLEYLGWSGIAGEWTGIDMQIAKELGNGHDAYAEIRPNR
jgi:hypothetical protein